MNFRATPLGLSSFLPALALGLLAATSSGCAAPEASFNAFGERYDEIFANKPPGACPETYVPLAPGDADGQYLLVLSPTQGPEEPIMFLAEVTTPAVGGDVGLGFTVTPLDTADRKTPVGDPQTFEPVAVDGSGKFEHVLALLAVPADANTVAPIKVEANITLAGNVCGDASFVCGDVTGETVSPKVSLDGSTFTLIAIDDPANHPDVVINCAQDPAKAL